MQTLVILGPTGSGKTGIAIKIAQNLNGEIISADSRAIYRGMDLGTAKPTKEEQKTVPHHGLDLVNPGDRFTVYDWKFYAEQKIAEIKSRGHLPIIAGGTGLYIDALVYDYHFEQKNCSDRTGVKPGFLLIGIKTDREILRARLRARIEQMFCDENLFTETETLVRKYGWGSQAMKSDIYEYVHKYQTGELTLSEAKEKAFHEDWHLARRQLTWFKRNKDIIWLPLDEVYDYISKMLDL